MGIVNTVTEASKIARDELIRINGALGVVMFQVESVNLISYNKNENKPTWKVKCSYYTDLSANKRVSKEVCVDKTTGDVIDLNGNSE